MSNDLLMGIGFGVLIVVVVLLLRYMLRSKEHTMESYSEPVLPASGEFQMVIEDIFMIKGRGLVVTGRVESGSIHVGQNVQILSADGSQSLESRVNAIESFRKKKESAQAGENVGLLIDKHLSQEQLQKGMIVRA